MDRLPEVCVARRVFVSRLKPLAPHQVGEVPSEEIGSDNLTTVNMDASNYVTP